MMLYYVVIKYQDLNENDTLVTYEMLLFVFFLQNHDENHFNGAQLCVTYCYMNYFILIFWKDFFAFYRTAFPNFLFFLYPF